MKKNSRLKSFFAILLAVSMIFQQSSLTVLATDDTYVEDATATPTPSENEAETYATEGADPVAEKQEEPQQVQETPAAEQAQEPTEAPAEQPTEAPAEQPTEAPAEQPTEAPAEQPTEAPAAASTETPATEPTAAPAAEVTEVPAAPEATATPAAEATATPTPEVSASPSETPTPEVTETPAETTEFSNVSVDNAIANVSLSTPISEKAVFVAKQYDEDSKYFDNAIGAVMNWAGQNNLALTKAVVYDLHFENEDGSELPYGDNATVNLQFNNPILNDLEYDNVENVKTYVLHVTENGVQDVNGGIAQNGNGAVTGVTIQTNGFSPFVIFKGGKASEKNFSVQTADVTDPFANISSAISFGTAGGKVSAAIKKDGNGITDIIAGSGYAVDLSVSIPKVNSQQVYYVDLGADLQKYFDLNDENIPTGGTDLGLMGTLGKWYLDKANSRVYMIFDTTPPTAFNVSSDITFNASAKTDASETGKNITIKIGDTDFNYRWLGKQSSLNVTKTDEGSYNAETGTVTFKVTVTSIDGNNVIRSLNDTFWLLGMADDFSVEVKDSNGESLTDSEGNSVKCKITGKTDNSFTITLEPEYILEKDKTITFTYTMKINPSKAVNGVNVINNTATINSRDNWDQDKSTSSAKWEQNLKVERPSVEKTKENETPGTEGTKGTVTWKIVAKKGDQYLDKDNTILRDSWNAPNLSLKNIDDAVVKITYDSGKTKNVTVADLKTADAWKQNDQSFEIDFTKVAAGCDVEKIENFEITYVTEVDPTAGGMGSGQSKEVTNTAEVIRDGVKTDGSSAGTTVVNDSDSGLAVSKTHTDISEADAKGIKKVTWKSEITVKAGNYKKLIVTDQLAANPQNIDGYIWNWFDVTKMDGLSDHSNSIIKNISISNTDSSDNATTNAAAKLSIGNMSVRTGAFTWGKNQDGANTQFWYGFVLTLLDSDTAVTLGNDIVITIEYVSCFDYSRVKVSEYAAHEIENTVTVENDNGTVSDSDKISTGFVKGGVDKAVYSSNNTNGIIEWNIKIRYDLLKSLYYNSANGTWEWPRSITITDTLPSGMKLIKVCDNAPDGIKFRYDVAGNPYGTEGFLDPKYVVENGSIVTVDILDVVKEFYEVKNKQDDLFINYRTKVADYDKYLKEGAKSYKNSVELQLGDRFKYDAEASRELKPGEEFKKSGTVDTSQKTATFTITGFYKLASQIDDPKYTEVVLIDQYGSALKYQEDIFEAKYGGTKIEKGKRDGIYYLSDPDNHIIEFHIPKNMLVENNIAYTLKVIPTDKDEASYGTNTVWLKGYEKVTASTKVSTSASSATGSYEEAYLSVEKIGQYEGGQEKLSGVSFKLFEASYADGKLSYSGNPVDVAKSFTDGMASFATMVHINKLYAIVEDASTTPERYQAADPVYVLCNYPDDTNSKLDNATLNTLRSLKVQIFDITSGIQKVHAYTVPVINVPKTEQPKGSLTIVKALEGKTGDETKFSVTVELKDEKGNAYTGKATVNGTEQNVTAGTVTVEISQTTGATISGLPVGTRYKVTENDLSEGQTAAGYSKVEVTGETGAIVAAGSTVTVNNKWEQPKGKLTIVKALEGKTGDETKFSVTVELKDKEGAAYTGKATVNGTEQNVTAGTVTVEISQTTGATISGLPVGTRYKVTENDLSAGQTAAGYSKVDVTGETGAIEAAGSKVTVNNKWEQPKGSLTIVKALEGKTGDETKFSVTVELKDKEGAAYTGKATVNGTDQNVTAGTVTVEISQTTGATISGLPVGTRYKVTENDLSEGQTAAGYGKVGVTGAEGNIEATGNTVTVNNKWEQPKGSLTIVKALEGKTGDETKFSVTVELKDKEGAAYTGKATVNGTDQNVTAGTVTVEISQTTGAMISGLPVGTRYKVTENDLSEGQTAAGYSKVEVTGETGAIVAAGSTVTVNNKWEQPKGSLTITKVSVGATTPDDAEFVVIGSDGIEYTTKKYSDFKQNGSFTVFNLPVGKYKVVEKNAQKDGFYLETTTSSNIQVEKDDETKITITNIYLQASITLGAVKSYNKTLTGGEFEFNLEQVKDANGTTITDSKPYTDSAKNDADGNVTFKEIKYTTAGIYYYKISEKNGGSAIEGIEYDNNAYVVTVTVARVGNKLVASADKAIEDITFTNTYTASADLELKAQKTLITTETPLAKGQFEFELIEIKEKTENVIQTQSNDEKGKVEFAPISYQLNGEKNDLGIHKYKVREVKGDAAGYAYDDTIYTINVTVTDAGNGTLTVTPVIHSSKATSEDATVTGMEFNNTYTTSGQIVLGATKTLEGQTLEAEQFSFQAIEIDADGNAVENGYNETVKNADGGAITFPIITYEKSGTHYYQITEVKDEKPAYQYDESKYVVKVDVTDDNAGKLTAKVTSVTKNGEPVENGEPEENSSFTKAVITFTNTYSASADLELKAQKFMKVEAEQLGTFEFELKDADGKVIETVKNDEKGAISFSKLSYTEKDAGKTFTYTVNEKLPSEADTYVYDKTVYTVTVNVEDNRDGTLKLTTKVNGEDYTETAMKFVNDTTKVTISKVDDTTLKALAGAKLQVVDDQDKVVEEWTSDGTPHVLTAKLVLGKTYKLVEAEAPLGYEIAEPITFTVDADDTKNAVEMKDAMTKSKTAAIEITKELKLNDALAGAKDMTFYAALFADAECTIPASDVKALEFKNASSSTVTFTNLDLGRTYYVSETDVTGKAIDSGMTPDEKVYVPVYPQGQAITVTEDGAKSSITFENQFSEWPDGFYKIATLNVTKKLLGADGNALESDKIFYAGIFDDKECTTLSTRTEKNILILNLAGGSTVSESTQAVVIPDESFTLYVAETDAEGNLVGGTDGFRYAVTVENGNVLFDENNLNAEVTIINQEQPEATPTVTPEETITPTPTPGTSTGVKTGDDTPIGFYMALLFVAALAIEETIRRRRKKEQD